jgi:hypothetical protein
MRIEAVPEGILETVAKASGLLPTPLVIGSWGMGASRCLITGTRLGVFEALVSGLKSAGQVAAETNCNPVGMETLLNALNGLGYLNRASGLYSNSKLTKKWLLKSSKHSVRDAVLFFQDIWEVMAKMEESVITGKTADLHHGGQPPEFWERYMRGLATFAFYTGKEIAWKVKLESAPKKLLDVAGGHGVYSMSFCKKYPGLKAEVLELADAARVGSQIVSEQKMADRVSYREGDMRTSDWGSGYDLILLFNIIHNLSQEECQQAVAKAFAALDQKGRLVILDSEHSKGDKNLSMAGGFNELLFFLTSGTRAYPEQTIRDWMQKAGFSSLRTQRLLSVPMTCLITGVR